MQSDIDLAHNWRREAWRSSGREEKYMAAFLAIGALELKRDRRLSQLRSGG